MPTAKARSPSISARYLKNTYSKESWQPHSCVSILGAKIGCYSRNMWWHSYAGRALKKATIAALALATLLAPSQAGVAASIRASNDGQTVAQLNDRLSPNRGLNAICSMFRENEPLCKFGAKPNVLLWGDSFAMQLALALKSGSRPLSFAQQTLSVCAPIFDIAPQNASDGIDFAKNCISENALVFDWLKRHKAIKYVILAGHWINALATHGIIYRTGGIIGHQSKYAFSQFQRTLRDIEALGVKPIVVTETPTNGANHADCVIKAITSKTDVTACNFLHASDTEKPINAKVAKYALAAGASVFWLEKDMCDSKTCFATRGDVIIYRDSHHISREASVYLGVKFNLGRQIIAATKSH